MCNGCATDVQWMCNGCAMEVQRMCNGSATEAMSLRGVTELYSFPHPIPELARSEHLRSRMTVRRDTSNSPMKCPQLGSEPVRVPS